jgi:hypothetical protein
VTPGAYRTAIGGGIDGFVVALHPDASDRAYATFLGGSGDDEPFALSLDSTGSVLIAGATSSTDFPTTAGSFQPLPPGPESGFVASLSGDGASLRWATYLGGTTLDRVLDLTIDALDRPVACGWTGSADLPTAGSPFDPTLSGPFDAFLAILGSDGATLVYNTYLGGDDDDTPFAVGLDPSGGPLAAGQTRSGDFPVSIGAFDATHGSPYAWDDAFVTALQPIADTCCTVTGPPGAPLLLLERSGGAPCPASGGAAGLDLVLGDLAQLAPSSIGPVIPLACDSSESVFPVGPVPEAGRGLFLVARAAGGTYVDGEGPAVVGARIPSSGDCP